jgi:hypothetical protein
MSAAYQHLALSQVKPGMILSDELLGRQGQILLPKGAVLTASNIALLPVHGIDVLAVLRADGAVEAEPIDVPAVEARLARLFRKHNPASPEADAWATGTLLLYMSDFRLAAEREA